MGLKSTQAANIEVMEEVKQMNVVGIGEVRKALKRSYTVQTYEEGMTGSNLTKGAIKVVEEGDLQ